MFVRMPYQFFKSIITNKEIGYFARILMLDIHRMSYMHHRKNKEYKCFLDASELSKKYHCSVRTVQSAIQQLQDSNLIKYHKFKARRDSSIESRHDKPIYAVTINAHHIVDEESEDVDSKEELQKKDYTLPKGEQKDIKDTIRDKNRSAKKQTQSGVKEGIKSNFNKFKEVFKKKTLKEFYPLDEQDISTLQDMSGRKFGIRATNQILLAVSKKKPNHSFFNKKSFMKYMSIILAYELREAIQVNNDSFTISANKTEEQVRNEEIESFLAKIEECYTGSKEDSFKRRIAASLIPNTAYNFLKKIKEIVFYESVLTIRTAEAININPREKDVIERQALSIYGNVCLNYSC